MVSLFLPVVIGGWLDGGDLCTSLTPIERKGSGRDQGPGKPGSWGHGDTALSCQHPHDACLRQGTEPGGPGVAPASPVAAEVFDGGLCSGPFHLKIKEQEKRSLSSLCFLQSRLFFPPSSSPCPLFVAQKQPLSVELSLRFWPLSSLCPGLLCYLFLSTTALPIAGRSPAARSLLFLQVWRCRGWEEHKVPGKSLAVPSICMSLPRNQQNFSQDKLREHPQQVRTLARKLVHLIPMSRSQALKLFSLVLCTLCLLNLPIMFLYKHQTERNLRCSYLHMSQKPSL